MTSTTSEIDVEIVDAAIELISAQGLAALTLERLADTVGLSRMTLHRRGVTRPLVVEALLRRAAESYVSALWPVLTRSGTARDRLSSALDAICTTADDHLSLLAGLFGAPESPFHQVGEDDALVTLELFAAPLARLLRDGELDGTLRTSADPDEAAAVMFNVVGWGYVHLRHSQQWPADRARPAVVNFALAAAEPIGRPGRRRASPSA